MLMANGNRTELLQNYQPGPYFCEMIGLPDHPATYTELLRNRLNQIDIGALRARAHDADEELLNLGITFTVYSDRTAIDRILPFDIIPRVISKEDWAKIERGIIQRVTTLNLFLKDIYSDQKVLADGIIPRDLVVGNENFRKEMIGLKLPYGTYINIDGTDLLRNSDGDFVVLEDNGRCPSGVSYVIENRHLMQRAFSDMLNSIGVRPVSNYGPKLLEALLQVAPAGIENPQAVLLSAGTYNSAFFEHVFLSREMGVPLVEGRDLVVVDDKVYMKTITGLEPVHVIYRRIDDAFLDPEVYNPESVLGVPGIMRAYWAGNVALANAVGTGVADDKAVYAYVPRLIKYYLGEEAVLPNVETHICREPEGLKYTLDHLKDLVVKPVGESGGYGITVGPKASRKQLAECRERLKDDPENFISQPMVQLSVSPTLVNGKIEPRHVDLRPYAVTGESTWVLPGGLTRVALPKGSIVVNSSQGGGSKDTWVLE
jgi:uncharacterized circularly permuted ATP-grasp superfamily protein